MTTAPQHMTRSTIIHALAALAVLFATGCVFPRSAGTPKEQIHRKGGEIDSLSSGGVKLTLTGARVTDLDLLSVAALSSNHREIRPIRILNLSHSKVSDGGLVHLHNLKSLAVLDLSHTEVTDAGVLQLKSRVPDCRVIRK